MVDFVGIHEMNWLPEAVGIKRFLGSNEQSRLLSIVPQNILQIKIYSQNAELDPEFELWKRDLKQLFMDELKHLKNGHITAMKMYDYECITGNYIICSPISDELSKAIKRLQKCKNELIVSGHRIEMVCFLFRIFRCFCE